MKKSYIIAFLFTAASLLAQTKKKYARIDSLLTLLQTHNKFMGSIALREGDKIVFAKAYGFSDVASQKPADIDTKYKAGSITKPFTAVLILQLVEEKKVSLDDKLSKYFPKVRNADKITVEMLLRHRTGIQEVLADPEIAQNLTKSHTREQIMDRIVGYKSVFEPGSKYLYSNSNYILLGYIIEEVTKISYSENIQKRIVSKIGLKNTSIPDKIDFAKNDAISAIYDGSVWVPIPEWSNTLASAAGALVSTPSDLTAFMKALFDGRLLDAVYVEKMKTIHEGYGLGLITLPFGSKTFYGHTGGIENFRSAVGYDPISKFGAAICVNGDNYDRNLIMQGVLSIYYGKEYTFPEVAEIQVAADILSSYVGTYSSPDFPLKITVTTSNGKLFTQATGQSGFAVEAKSTTSFEYKPAGIVLEFSPGKMNLKQSGLDINFTKE